MFVMVYSVQIIVGESISLLSLLVHLHDPTALVTLEPHAPNGIFII